VIFHAVLGNNFHSVADPCVLVQYRALDLYIAADPQRDFASARLSAAETPVDYAEDLVVLNYKEDERYYPHCDSFLPELPEQAAEIERKGQRIRTCLVYLNEDFAGGETHFLHPEKKIRCPAGTALIFENINEEGDADEHSVHEGLPVTSGEKWLASKWFRDKSQVLF